jgi:hypothetical protein
MYVIPRISCPFQIPSSHWDVLITVNGLCYHLWFFVVPQGLTPFGPVPNCSPDHIKNSGTE